MANLKTRKMAAKFLKIGSEVADLVVQMRSASPLNLAAIGLRAVQTHLDNSPSFDQYLRGWNNANLDAFVESIRILCGTPNARHECQHGIVIEEFHIHGVHIANAMSGNRGSLWVSPKHSIADARTAIGRLMWESLGSAMLATASSSYGITRWSFEPDPLAARPVLSSKVADDLYNWVQRFLAAGKHRAVLLRGEPGTGKSCVMRNVAARVGGFCLRLDGRTTLSGDLENTLALLRFLQPNVVVFDDLDRYSTGSLLSCLEIIRDFAKVTLASANYEKLIDPAARRPGRFDRIIELKHLDEATIDALIGDDVPEEIAAKLRTLPVAYIDDFHTQREVLGLDEALEGVLELERRAREIETDGEQARATSPEIGKYKYVSPGD